MHRYTHYRHWRLEVSGDQHHALAALSPVKRPGTLSNEAG